jgi:high-affinity iron transporter
MVDAVLLVLREVLEAALIISLLLALSRQLGLSFRWGSVALVGGFIGSWLLANYAYEITDAFDGAGQELLNSVLYLAVILSIIGLSLLMLSLALPAPQNKQQGAFFSLPLHVRYWLLHGFFVVTVSFSVAREGSEIWIYLSSFTHHSNTLYPALIGAVIGSGIGMSLGAITFYSLVFMRRRFFLPVFLLVMTLLVGGLSMQIAKQLMQVGLLDSTAPLWDSSFLISEQSWLGEILYALLGYDAKPTLTQGIFYLAAILPILLGAAWHFTRVRMRSYD